MWSRVLARVAKVVTTSSAATFGVMAYLRVSTVDEALTESCPPKKQLFTWGNNASGQLGQGSEKNSPIPTLLEHLEHTSIKTAVARGRNSACIMEDTGKVYTFGNGSHSILGHGDSMDQPNQTLPTKVNGLGNKECTAVCIGGFHMMVIDDDQKVWSWGRNNRGQLGLGEGTSGDYGKPQPLSTLTNIVALAAGRQHSLALNERGEVHSWGCGRDGALGLGDKNIRKSPTKINELEDVVAIACGRDSSFALTKNGKEFFFLCCFRFRLS